MLDEVETIQRVRGDVRDKSLNALRQLIDEIDSGRFPGLYLLITGTAPSTTGRRARSGWSRWPSGCTSISRPRPASTTRGPSRSACRASTSIGSARSAARSATSSSSTPRPRSGSPRPATTPTSANWPRPSTGRLGGKVGVAPRIFLKKLVADVLDRVDQFPDFDPRQHYALTIAETELTPVERQAMGASDVDEIELEL